MNDITAFFAFLKYCLGYKVPSVKEGVFRIPPSPFR